MEGQPEQLKPRFLLHSPLRYFRSVCVLGDHEESGVRRVPVRQPHGAV